MQQPVPVTGIWLHSSGDELHVCAEIDGRWRRLFTEHREGPISHIMEPAGMRRAPLEPLGGAVPAAEHDQAAAAAEPDRPGHCDGCGNDDGPSWCVGIVS